MEKELLSFMRRKSLLVVFKFLTNLKSKQQKINKKINLIENAFKCLLAASTDVQTLQLFFYNFIFYSSQRRLEMIFAERLFAVICCI